MKDDRILISWNDIVQQTNYCRLGNSLSYRSSKARDVYFTVTLIKLCLISF